jgi:hypothetical protein
MEERLEEFLNTFYETMSFESVEKFDSEKFLSLFTRNAMLAERAGETLCYEMIDDYVHVFEEEAKRFPEHYSYGLQETQIGYQRLNGEDFVLVKSDYEKRVTQSEAAEGESREQVTHGCNYMTLCRDGDWFKIMSLAWTAHI